MKTTLEVPSSLFRQAKASAARRGQTLAAFVNAAIEAKLRADESASAEKPWMKFAAIHADEKRDSERVLKAIEEGCEVIDSQQWQ